MSAEQYHVSAVKLILTCEHGGNEIPPAYNSYFLNEAVLNTHRAYDLGALDLFQSLKPLADAAFYSTHSRLFIELNRSLHHRQLFSAYMKGVSKSQKEDIIKTYYWPYRTPVENSIRHYIKTGHTVLHLSIHSFTPELNGKTRQADIGLLYDSTNQAERQFCKLLKAELLILHPDLNVRFNYPYLGTSDGFTRALRTQFTEQYLGIEIEVNQKFSVNATLNPKISQLLYTAIKTIKTKCLDF